MSDTLGDALPREMARVRDKVIPVYRDASTSGAFAVHLMQRDLDRAATALAENDIAAMIAMLKELREWKI